MAMNRPDDEPNPERREAVVQHDEKDEAALPDAVDHTPRVTSNDWILEYVQQEPLRCVSLGSVFDEQEGSVGLDPIPLPIDTENFVADELFDFLKKIERQGKGLHALDTLAKKSVGGNVDAATPPKRKSTQRPRKRPHQEHIFDTPDQDSLQQLTSTREGHVVSPQEGNLAVFLRSIEERYEVLRGEQQSRWQRHSTSTSTHFASRSLRPGPSLDQGVVTADSCEESTASIGGGSTTPLSASSISQGEGIAPSPLTLSGQATRGKSGEEERRVYCEPTDVDVLLGRGGLTNHHAGNKRYRHEIDQLKPWYHSCQTKSEKKELSALFLEYIHGYGGRFLEREDETGRWYVANYRRARKKASQALREFKKQKRGQEGGAPPPGT